MRAGAAADGPPKRKRGPGTGPASNINVAASSTASLAPRQRVARFFRKKFAITGPIAFVLATEAGIGGGNA
jgi:hypothetical protein